MFIIDNKNICIWTTDIGLQYLVYNISWVLDWSEENKYNKFKLFCAIIEKCRLDKRLNFIVMAILSQLYVPWRKLGFEESLEYALVCVCFPMKIYAMSLMCFHWSYELMKQRWKKHVPRTEDESTPKAAHYYEPTGSYNLCRKITRNRKLATVVYINI